MDKWSLDRYTRQMASDDPLTWATKLSEHLCFCWINYVSTKGERMVSKYVFPTLKHWGGVMAWGCFAFDTIGALIKIQDKLNWHGYHSILKWHAIPSGLRLRYHHLFFNNRTLTLLLRATGYLTKKKNDAVLYQMTWSPESSWPKFNWDGMGWVGP